PGAEFAQPVALDGPDADDGGVAGGGQPPAVGAKVQAAAAGAVRRGDALPRDPRGGVGQAEGAVPADGGDAPAGGGGGQVAAAVALAEAHVAESGDGPVR